MSGAVVLVLEICAARLISPFFGSTVYVWSASIAVTLAALAAGYAVGGRLADAREAWGALAAVFSAASVCLLIVPFVKTSVLTLASKYGVVWGALASVGVLAAPPLFLLGAAAPLTVRLATKDIAGLGRGMGGVSAVSTLGSVLGALAAGFWLVPIVPTSRLIAVCAGILGCLGAFCARLSGAGPRRAVGGAALLICAAGLSASAPRGEIRDGTLLEQTHGHYGDIKVVDRPRWGKRFLYVDGISNTVADLDSLDSVSDYISGLELAAWMRTGPRRALVIGLGGGALPMRLARRGIPADVCDVDPAMPPIAREYFGFRPVGGVFLEDGRRYLERSGPSYDLIVYDAFTGDRQPSHLFTIEGLRAAKDRLAPGGLVVLNVIGYGRGARAGLKAGFEETLGRLFKEVRVLAANRGLDLDESYLNLVFFASDGPLDIAVPESERRSPLASYLEDVRENFLSAEKSFRAAPFTDDFNPIDALSAPGFLALRRDILGYNRDVLAYGL